MIAAPFAEVKTSGPDGGSPGPDREPVIVMPTSDDAVFAEIVVDTDSPDETQQLARRLGEALLPGHFVALVGPLGAGKTAFVQGLAAGLKVEGAVTSPTFVLMRLHRGDTPLCHVDAYRLPDASAVEELGLEDWRDDCVIAMEWADTVPEALPRERIEVVLSYRGEGRRIRLRGIGRELAAIVQEMEHYAHTGD